jgi:hypothetical protein
MSGFIVTRLKDSIGPTFNEAAQKLEAISDVTVTRSLKGLQIFAIDATEESIKKVSKELPGWAIERENTNVHIIKR